MKTPADSKSIGSKIVEGMREFTEALESGKVISEHFTCHNVTLKFKPNRYSPLLVKKTRKALRLSQALFANFLGVSPQTVRAWEQGVNVPNDMACRFMDEIRLDPDYWLERFRKLAVIKTSKAGVKKRTSRKAALR
jgi:putative transcriptional regulator